MSQFQNVNGNIKCRQYFGAPYMRVRERRFAFFIFFIYGE